MRKILLYFAFFSCFACSDKNSISPDQIETGISLQLAQYRKKVLSDIHYDLKFKIPKDKNENILAQERIEFVYKSDSKNALLLDFKEKAANIKKITLNGEKIPATWIKEHILLPKKHLKNGLNQVDIEFIAGNGALNRREDYLYSLFVPDRVRSVFPVFDQPDLKAEFSLTLEIPKNWVATSNGKMIENIQKESSKVLTFAKTEKLPTYLFSFVAGKFKVATEPWRNTQIELYYRETNRDKIEESLPSIFSQYKEYVEFYENWTGIKYPFQKHGMVAIPNFQFGGMEHPGALLLQNSTLFLTKDATESQRNNRAQLLAHEIAHMWFGDLVTMKWFNDVWTKEVFANFMADKATANAENTKKFDLKFLTDHFPAAYSVDRTLGANPIRQKLDNLENAGTMYGNIIYHKAPIMMRQLENLMGEKPFQEGIKKYLKKFSYGNASWPDLIDILNQQTKTDLIKWNKVWVNRSGRPVFDKNIIYKNQHIQKFEISQTPEFGEKAFWPQSFDISFYYPNSVTHKTILNQSSHETLNDFLNQPQPKSILFNPSGMGYGVFPIETKMNEEIFNLKDEVARASAYINLYENMLNGRNINVQHLFSFFLTGIKTEKEELNLRLLTRYLYQMYWIFLSHNEREKIAASVEENLWKAFDLQENTHNKKTIFTSLQNLFISDATYNKLYKIWETQTPPKGITLLEEDYTGMALELALRKPNPNLLETQLGRIENPDRRKRFHIISPALSFDKNVRDSIFQSFTLTQGRTNESAVSSALSYLHHPLRQPSAEKYLQKSLELLPEIQKTGDIFFPTNWLEATFGLYRDEKVYLLVSNYLKENPQLNPKLKEKILQATDNLRRTQDLKKAAK